MSSSNHVVSFLIRAKDGATKTLHSIGSAITSLGSALLRNGANIQAWGQMIGSAVAKVQGVFGTLWGAIKESFKFETLTVQFKTLLGSMDAARERMAMLAKFAETTPFEMEEVARASRTLTVMSGDALGSAWALRTVGDAAAATGANIEELSMWIGRAYAMIQAGKPFGEAAMRLSELGVITPQVRAKMEELQAAGASSVDVWTTLTDHLATFDGAMLDLSRTGDGLTSTLSDNWTAAVRTFGDAFQKVAKESIQFLINLLAKLQADGTIQRWAEAAVRALTPVKDLITAVLGGQESRGQALTAAWDYLKAVWDYGAKTIKTAVEFAGNILYAYAMDAATEIRNAFRAIDVESPGAYMREVAQTGWRVGMAANAATLEQQTKAFASAVANAAEIAKAEVASAAQSAAPTPAQAAQEREEGKARATQALLKTEREMAANEDAEKALLEATKEEEKAAKLRKKAAEKEAEEAKKRLEEARRRALDSDYEKEQRHKERRAARKQAKDDESLRKRAQRLSARFATLTDKNALLSDDFDTRKLTHRERALREWMLAQIGNADAQAKKSEAERQLATIAQTLQHIRQTNERLLSMA